MFSVEQIIKDQQFKAYSHFNERLNKRYGIEVTEAEWLSLCRSEIDIVQRKTRNRALGWIMVKGFKVLVIKDIKRKRFLATALPPEMLDPPKPKFQQIAPKQKWTQEKTNERIEKVKSEIIELDKQVGQSLRQIRFFENQKAILQKKVSNKTKYLNQLKHQLVEEYEEWREL